MARETARVLDAAVEVQRVKSENAGKARIQQVIGRFQGERDISKSMDIDCE